MVAQVIEDGNDDVEMFDQVGQTSAGRVRESDRVITLEQYGYGDHPSTLEELLMRFTDTQSSENMIQLMRNQVGNRCYVWTTTQKPKTESKVDGELSAVGKFILKDTDKNGKPFQDASGKNIQRMVWEDPVRLPVFKKDADDKDILNQYETEEVVVLVLTPELNQTVPREDIGPDGQYPRWLWFEKNRRYIRSNRLMRRFLEENPGVTKYEAFRILTEQDEITKQVKAAEAKSLSSSADSLEQNYPGEFELIEGLREKAKWSAEWNYAPYSVYYPYVGAMGNQPPPTDPTADEAHWVPSDWVYRRGIRMDLVPTEPDPRDFVTLVDGVFQPLIYEKKSNELEPFDGDPTKVGLINAAEEEIRQRFRFKFTFTGENKRFGVQEQFPNGLYYNAAKEQYEVYICDLDFRGRTALAHADCAADVETQEQVWNLFDETARRKGFKTLHREELDDLNLTKAERQDIWADYLSRLDAFVSEFYDRSYPSEQLKISKTLSRVFGAQGWNPLSMAQAKRDLVSLAVWVETPPEVTWEWNDKKSEFTPRVNYRPFRYRARNVERIRKIFHWIRSWQSARGVGNRREEASLDSGTLSRYISNDLGGEWEPRPYRQDVRAYYHMRIANRFAPLDVIKAAQPDLDWIEQIRFVYAQIEEPTASQQAWVSTIEKQFQDAVDEFRYYVNVRHSILDWAWFFKEPWMKMPHDGSLVYSLCETWISQLDIFGKERGLNSAAGDGAFPKWEVFVDKYTSLVRNYEDESRWSSTIEMAKRDPIYSWKDLRMILGLYNNLAVVNVRVSSKGSYELWPDIRLNYDNATRGRDFIRLMWRNLPVDPLMESIDHSMEEDQANGVTDTLSHVTRHMEGMPSKVVAHGMKPRLGIEAKLWERRERAFDWMVRRLAEQHFLGGARVFKSAGEWFGKLGWGRRIGKPKKTKGLMGKVGFQQYMEAVLDTFQRREELRDMKFVMGETDFRDKGIEANKFSASVYFAEDFPTRGVFTAAHKRYDIADWLARWAGFPAVTKKQREDNNPKGETMVMAEKIRARSVSWSDLKVELQGMGKSKEEIGYVEAAYFTFKDEPLDMKV